LETFYLEYHKIIKEAMEFIEPSLLINVHSHDKELVSPSLADTDIVLYNSQPESEVTERLQQALIDKHFKVSSLRYLPNNHSDLCSPMVFEGLLGYYEDGRKVDGCYLSVESNKLIFDEEWSSHLASIITDTFQEEINK
jgi:hypothetical protein